MEKYNKIIDCYFLLEDTELAKKDFLKFGIGGATKKPSDGELYLRSYGLLNACYLQKEAIKTCFNVLGIKIEKNNLEDLKIFEYRNIFAAHNTDKNIKGKERSFLQCRISLREGILKGYSSSRKGVCTIYKKGIKFEDLINDWNKILLIKLKEILEKLFLKETDYDDLNKLKKIFNKIKDGKSIITSNGIIINYVYLLLYPIIIYKLNLYIAV